MKNDSDIRSLLQKLLCFGGMARRKEELTDALLSRFSSPRSLFTASVKELMQVGLSESCAILFHMQVPFLRRCQLSAFLRQNKTLDTAEKLGEMFRIVLQFLRVEQFYAALLDKDFHLLKLVKLSEGTVNATALLPRNLAELAIAHRASYFAIAHNHPGGELVPSTADEYTTKELQSAMDPLGIPLLEHFVISDGADASFRPLLLFQSSCHFCKQISPKLFYSARLLQEAKLSL